ncbi:MAG TPA: MFS transporter [Streptosporangiaceae bacterium]|jgi:predicted MFS family arabinose efflux permease|nr:MFS transporter [Streptosporangiaceae bacterium]
MSPDAGAAVSGGPGPGPARSRWQLWKLVPGPIRLLTLGVLVNRTGGFVVVFLALILAARGFRAWQIGIMLALVGGFGIAGAALGGAAAGRLGPRRTIVYSTAACALLTAILAFTTGFVASAIVLSAISLFNRAYMPASAAIVGRLSPPDQLAPMFAFYQLAVNVGAAAGALIAGFVLGRSLVVLLLIDAATTAAFTVAAGRLPDDKPARAERRASRSAAGRKSVLRDHRYLVLCIAFGLIALVYGQRSGVLPLALHARHYSVELVGELLSANAIAVVLFELPLATVVRRWPSWLPLSIGAGLICGGYAVYLLGVSMLTILGGVALWTIGEMFVTPFSSATASAMAPDGSGSSYQGVLQVYRTAGLTAGPAVGVFAYAAGRSVPWWGCAAAGLACIAIIVSILRRGPTARPDARPPETQSAQAEEVA